uniref:Uncharacterized protein n=1 Tax=Salmo trutta TaxID=8032 RepID=A0A673WHU8_SALTR
MTSLSLSLGLLVLCTLALVHCDLDDSHVIVCGLSASNLRGDLLSQPDPYVKVWCGPAFGGMTNIIHKSVVKLEMWDDDAGPDNRLGTCTTTVHPGTHTETCHLKRGTVYYSYSYKKEQQQ